MSRMNLGRIGRLVIAPDSTDARLTTAERVALDVRSQAALTGRCPCGATMGIPADAMPGEVILVKVVHEDDCPAISAAAIRGLAKLAGGR